MSQSSIRATRRGWVSRLVAALGTLAAAALVVAGCGGSSSSAGQASATEPAYHGPVAQVSLALDWTPNTNHTGIYVALQKGWYREQGIDLTLTPYSSSVAPEQLVSTGKAQFAISFVESVTQGRAVGQPLVSIAAVIQHNTSALVSLKSSGLDAVAKLAGKRYAGFGAPYEQPVISTVLKCGNAPSTDFQNVTTQLDPIQALKSKQFDFAWVYMGWEGIQAQREGLDLNVFPIVDNCVPDYYSPVIVSSESFIKSQPDVVRRFVAATARGYTYAVTHPKEAADLLIQAAPAGTFDDTGLVYASQNYLSLAYAKGAKCWGQQTAQAWTAYPQFMYQSGSLSDANGKALSQPPDYAAAYTDTFLPSC